MTSFYIFPGTNELFVKLFEEIVGKEGVTVAPSIFRKGVNRKNLLRLRAHQPSEWVEYVLTKMFRWDFIPTYDPSTTNVLVFSNISVTDLGVIHLKKLQQKGYKLVLYFLDSMSNVDYTREAFDYTKRVSFDVVYTFDLGDAEKYGLKHAFTMYSSLASGKDTTIKYDYCYIGSNKGRYGMVRDFVRQHQNAQGFVSMFQASDEEVREGGFDGNLSLSYEEVVKYTLQSNCLLDIVAHKGQSGLSIRPYEAVVYNRRLITNNPSIKDFPYYNPNYMLCVNDLKEVPDDFLQDRSPVDYRYRGDFSPIRFLERIDSDIR